tara:strand:+ start:299 stop:1423 length:1125 start_codon:yes stop_codon:yes gene_type:complete
MAQLPNNLTGLLNNPLLTVGINPNAQMLPPQPMGGFGVPQNPMMGMPQMMPQQQQKPTSFADRLKSLIPALGDYYQGRSIAGGASLDPRSGDANFVNAMGLQNVQNQRRTRQALANQLQQQQLNNQIAQTRFSNEQEDRLLAKQQRERFKDIFANIDRKNYANDGAYARAIGTELIKSGNIKDGLEFFKFGKPLGQAEKISVIKDFRKLEQKLYDPIAKSVNNYKDLQTALNQNDGVGAYSAMIKYIKNLDDSVVREGEVATFRKFQGLIKGMQTALDQNVAGKNFPPEILASMDKIARESINTLVDSYNANKIDRSENQYPSMGIDPLLIYSGMNIPDYGKPFSPQNTNNTEKVQIGTDTRGRPIFKIIEKKE